MILLSSDLELRDRLISDPDSHWPDFWHQFGALIKGRIRAFRLSREDFEDVLQDISLHLIKNNCATLRNWDPSRSSLSSYLKVVVSSRCLDYIKSQFYKEMHNPKILPTETDDGLDLLEIIDSGEKDPSERLQLLRLSAAVDQVLNGMCKNKLLKPVDRQLILLRAYGLSFKEIGVITGMREGTLMTRFSRLRSIVSDRLQQAGIGPEVTED